jgi:hypothetical protein
MKTRSWFIALAAILLAVSPAIAQWVEDSNPVCTVGSPQYTAEMVPDGRGGAIVVWQDYRRGSYSDLFAQRVDRFGRPMWTDGGVSVCIADSNQTNHKVVSDGAGGAIIVWADNRKGTTNADIYAQRIDSSGNAVWTADGIAVCDTVSYQKTPAIASDMAGGAIVAWSDFRTGNYNIYAQRISKTGTLSWTRNGVAICDTVGAQDVPVMVTNEYSGAYIAWQDYRSGTNYDIYVQMIQGNGTALWTRNGVAVCDTTGHQTKPAITVSSYEYSAYIAWQDYRSGTNYDVYIQKIGYFGDVGSTYFIKNGRRCSSNSGNELNPVILCPGESLYVAYETNAAGHSMIEIDQFRDGAYIYSWYPDLLGFNNSYAPKLALDGAGGVTATWYSTDPSTGNSDIYAYRCNILVQPQWPFVGMYCGNLVSAATGNQTYPAICSDETGGAIIAWQDTRNGTTNADIYAQRLDGYDGSYYGCNAPAITGIEDIPNDQGGYVNLQWTPSVLDAYPDTIISFYSLWRSLTGDAAKSLISKGAKLVEPSDITIDFTGPAYRLTELGSKTYAWEWIANIPWKHYLTAYSYPMPTLCDTLTGQMAWHHFFVSAQTDNPLLYWDSYPDSGFSVDDLAPAKVIGLDGEVSASLVLAWKRNTESDLRDYAVYCNGILVGFTTDTNYTYTGSLNTNDCFTISAYDIHNNEGIVSDQWIYLGPQAVHLSFFTVGQTNEAVELRWRTESESDCASWIIQRSTIIVGTFADIGRMPGQGTSTEPHDYFFRDTEPLNTGEYQYRIVEVSTNGGKTYYQPVSVTYKSTTPKVFSLIGAYPNPSRGQTTIRYQLPKAVKVELVVYNVAGQVVGTFDERTKFPGDHQVRWNAGSLPNGIYFFTLHAGSFSATKRVTIIK